MLEVHGVATMRHSGKVVNVHYGDEGRKGWKALDDCMECIETAEGVRKWLSTATLVQSRIRKRSSGQ